MDVKKGGILLTGSLCAAPVSFYARAVATGALLIDHDERRLPLRHLHHRYRIDGPGGVQTLTIPLDHDTHTLQTPMRDVRISEHGNWRHKHWGALFSAYGRTPYFDYFADDLRQVLFGKQRFLVDFNAQLHAAIVDFLALPIVTHVWDGVLTETIIDKRACDIIDEAATKVRYYQMWAATRDGAFAPDLSILDLLMNVGREAQLLL